MAESVDALVSNTSNFTVVPVRPRLWVRKKRLRSLFYYKSNKNIIDSHFTIFYSLKSIKNAIIQLIVNILAFFKE